MAEKRRPCKGTCGRNRAERFFRSPRARVCLDCQRKTRRKTAHGARIAKTYGLTAVEYKQLLDFQGGVCAICGGTRKGNLDVDHDHITGIIRGLLCKRDNRHLLPAAQDNTSRLAVAIHYLRNPPAVQLLGERKVKL